MRMMPVGQSCRLERNSGADINRHEPASQAIKSISTISGHVVEKDDATAR